MNSKNKLMTNTELQERLSEAFRSLSEAEPNTELARANSSVADKILAAVRIDMEAAGKLGRPYFKRTHEFLQTADE